MIMFVPLGEFLKYVDVLGPWECISKEEHHAFIPKETIEPSRAMNNALKK